MNDLRKILLLNRGENVFKDRVDAGRQLAEELVSFVGGEGLVLAIPRGGVVVGFEVAQRLNLIMDLSYSGISQGHPGGVKKGGR